MAAGTGDWEASEREADLVFQADGLGPEPGQTEEVGEGEVDSRNVQVAGGIGDLDVGDEAEEAIPGFPMWGWI